MKVPGNIEEMARVLDACPFIGASIGCDKHDGSIKIAEYLYHEGYSKQSEWISVEDRLPDVGDDYIVVVKLKYKWETEWEYHTDVAGFVFFDGYIDDVWNTFNDWNEGQECHVTHWMPLPQPPR